MRGERQVLTLAVALCLASTLNTVTLSGGAVQGSKGLRQEAVFFPFNPSFMDATQTLRKNHALSKDPKSLIERPKLSGQTVFPAWMTEMLHLNQETLAL